MRLQRHLQSADRTGPRLGGEPVKHAQRAVRTQQIKRIAALYLACTAVEEYDGRCTRA